MSASCVYVIRNEVHLYKLIHSPHMHNNNKIIFLWHSRKDVGAIVAVFIFPFFSYLVVVFINVICGSAVAAAAAAAPTM